VVSPGESGKIMSANEGYIIRECRKCGAKNRIPESRIREKAFCGKCHAPIYSLIYEKAYGQPTTAHEGNFKSEVLSCKSPVLVDFWASGCGYCRIMSPILDAIAMKYVGRIKVVKVNVEENPSIAAHYRISSIPSLLFFKNGTVRETLQGALPREELEKHVERIIP